MKGDFLTQEWKNIKVSADENIVIITMSRPKALNALNSETLEELRDVVTQIKFSDDVYGVIITGEGKAFVAGADIAQMQSYGALEGRAYIEQAQSVFNLIENLEKPVIAAVNGYALGGGCELSLSCDIRIGSKKAVFGQPEINLGVVACFGGTQRLPRTIPVGIAKELMFTGRNVLADEAKQIGLLNMVTEEDELMSKALEMAKLIASKSPIAVRYTKTSINKGLDVPISAGLELERDLASVTFATEDKTEGMSAFLEKRKANWKNK